LHRGKLGDEGAVALFGTYAVAPAIDVVVVGRGP
jgi:hypothetical protein